MFAIQMLNNYNGSGKFSRECSENLAQRGKTSRRGRDSHNVKRTLKTRSLLLEDFYDVDSISTYYNMPRTQWSPYFSAC
jgi:hypothetical protein